MRRRLLLAGAVVALVAASGAEAAALRVRSVSTDSYPLIEVTAVSPSQRALPLTLRENGQRVQGLRIESLARSKALVLAIDRSQSMRGKAIADAARAARGFIAAKPPSDRLEIVAFGSRAAALTQFSGATIDADIVLRTLDVDDVQGTALYDAVVLASRDLRREALPGKVLVLLTDGANLGGEATLAQAINQAKVTGTAVYPIAITSDQIAVKPLRRLARATGGSFYAAPSSSALAGVYARVAAELRRTWRLSYPTAARPGATLRLSVAQRGVGTASTVVTVPGENADARESSQVLPIGFTGPGWSGALVALAAGLLLLFAWRLAVRRPRAEELKRMLAPHVGDPAGKVEETQQGVHARDRLRHLSAATERRFGRFELWHKLARLLERSAVPLRPGELIYVALGVGVGFALFTAASFGSMPVTVLALALGTSLPFFVVALKARKRLRAFDEQLPDLLAAVAASLKAGHSLKQGLQGVIEESGPPTSVEFGRVLAEARLGRPLEEALDAMCARIGSEDLAYVSTAVSVQEQVGGSLAELFDMVSDTVRERQQHRRKVRALTAMGRASAYVLTVMPFALAGMITLINASYMAPLFGTGTGQFLVVLAIVMIALGALMLKKIVTVRG
jgi:tight adherence protein B